MSNTTTGYDFERTTFYQPWWISLLRGIVIFAVGLLATIWPAQTFIFLVRLIGLYFLVDGLFVLFMSIGNKKHDIRWRGTLMRGIIQIIIGALVAIVPAFTAAAVGTVLIYLLALLSLFAGVMDIVKAVKVRKEIKDEWAIVFSGVFLILLAIVLILSPLQFGMLIMRIVGILAIIAGVGFFIFALRTRKFVKD